MKILAITNIYPSTASPASGVFVEQQILGLRRQGVDVQVIFIDRRREGALSYYQMEPRIRCAVSEFSPDLIHVMYGGVMADQVTSLTGLPPVVVTFHGSDLLGENLSGLVRKLISRYGVYCSHKAARRAAGVVVVADHLAKCLPRLGNRVRVIPCGIDFDRFRPLDRSMCRHRLGWSAAGLHVLFASSSNDPVKRPWLAREAVARVESSGIPASFHILTGVSNEDVPIWLNASDVLLLTSLHEGSPTIVKEALACNVPVVSVDVGDVSERIRGISGCYLSRPVAGELASGLMAVARAAHNVEGRLAMDPLSLEKVAERLIDFYQSIIAQWAKTHERIN